MDKNEVPFEVKHKYIKRTGQSGNYRYFYRDQNTGRVFSSDKELPKNKKEVTHEHAVSVIKRLNTKDERAQSSILEDFSTKELKFIRDTAQANLSGGTEFSRKYSRNAITPISKEINRREKKEKQLETFIRATQDAQTIADKDKDVTAVEISRDLMDSYNLGAGDAHDIAKEAIITSGSRKKKK